jgi:hypothetical protein
MTARPLWWQWPTILSLDAPVVSVLWQWLLARAAGVDLGWAPVAVLGLSVWLAYAADRWIEGWRLPTDSIRTSRHHFYQRHRWPVAALWLAGFAGDVAIALQHLRPIDLRRGSALAAAVGLYLLSHQLLPRRHRWRPPKELWVAALLTGGIVLFLLDAPGARDLPLPVALFALLAFTNCALISVWERDVDIAHGQTSLALEGGLPHALIRQLPLMIAVIALAAGSLGHGPSRPAALAAVASALLMAVIDRYEPRAGRQAARVLADVALMTPVFVFWFRL